MKLDILYTLDKSKLSDSIKYINKILNSGLIWKINLVEKFILMYV